MLWVAFTKMRLFWVSSLNNKMWPFFHLSTHRPTLFFLIVVSTPMYYLTTLLWVDIFIVSHFTIIKQGLHKHVCTYAYIVLQAKLLKVALLLCQKTTQFSLCLCQIISQKGFPNECSHEEYSVHIFCTPWQTPDSTDIEHI